MTKSSSCHHRLCVSAKATMKIVFLSTLHLYCQTKSINDIFSRRVTFVSRVRDSHIQHYRIQSRTYAVYSAVLWHFLRSSTSWLNSDCQTKDMWNDSFIFIIDFYYRWEMEYWKYVCTSFTWHFYTDGNVPISAFFLSSSWYWIRWMSLFWGKNISHSFNQNAHNMVMNRWTQFFFSFKFCIEITMKDQKDRNRS